MEIITSSDFKKNYLNSNLKIIKYGRPLQPKVYEKDNTIIKLFYPKKRWFSSNLIKPQALRFRDNIIVLRQKGYHVPEMLQIKYCQDLKIYIVHYNKIIGEDLRALAQLQQWHIIDKAAKLVASLHQQGIYFRAMHLENLLFQPNQNFALIDITDVRFSMLPLNPYKRFRNLLHMFTMYEDQSIWKQYGIARFLNLYYQHAKLNRMSQWMLQSLMHKYLISK